MVIAFWRELKERGVPRAVLVYAVAGFALLLSADAVALAMDYPAWLHKVLVQTLLLGLIVTAAVAWFFDLGRDMRPVGGRDLDEIRAEEKARAHSVRRAWLAAAGIIVLIFAVGAIRGARSAAPDVAQSRYVVAPIENRTGDAALDPLSDLLADWITQRLVHTQGIEVVPYSAVVAWLDAASLPSGRDDQRALQIGRGVGAGVVLFGSIFINDNGSLVFNAKLYDTRKGAVLREVSSVGTPPHDWRLNVRGFREIAAWAVARERGARLAAWPFKLLRAPELTAHATYIDGLREFARQNFDTAEVRFAHAVELDTLFNLPRVWQARALLDAGRIGEADSIANAANDRRERLTMYDRTLLDHVIARAHGDLEERYATSTTFSAFAPASDDAARLLAIDALAVNHPRQARTVLLERNPQQGWLRSWPGYYATLATAQHVVSNHREEQRAAETGVIAFRYALPLRAARCRADVALGSANAVERMQQVYRLNPPGRYRPGEALLNCASEAYAHGRARDAQRLSALATAWYESRGPRDFGRALAQAMAGRPDKAYQTMRAVADTSAVARTRLAWFAAHAGNTAEATALLDAVERETAAELPEVQLERARVHAELGHAMIAIRLYADARSAGIPFAEPDAILPHADFMLRKLWGNRVFQGLLQPGG